MHRRATPLRDPVVRVKVDLLFWEMEAAQILRYVAVE